ncbi:hypothetical protein D3C81_2325530 [compost metagenome]
MFLHERDMHIDFKPVFGIGLMFNAQRLRLQHGLDVGLVLLIQVQRSTQLRKLIGFD